MKDSEFLALIKLLDDSDTEVRHIAENKLLAEGKNILERLESAADEIGDHSLHFRILNLAASLRQSNLSAQLLEWRKGGGEDMLEGWVMLSEIKPDSPSDKIVKNEVSRLASKVWLEIQDSMRLHDKLKVINHFLFTIEGYQLEKQDPENPDLFFADKLIATKSGNAQALSLLYLCVAKKLDLPLSGVILPEYMVLYCFDETRPFFLDVPGGGNFVSKEGIQLFIHKLKVPDAPSFYRPASHIQILLSVLEGLKRSYARKDRQEMSMLVDMVLQDIDIHF